MTQTLECKPLYPGANPELSAIKLHQQALWAAGDFSVIGTTLQIVGESLCEAADLRAGSAVLDVACGNGNSTLAAARRFCRVTGVDYVPALLERAAERARAERLAPTFVEGDAERLPFTDAIFDCVLSTFGVMFAPDQRRAAKELIRVCRPGGKIALASWTPEGFIGELLRAVARYVPPPPGTPSPLRWGSALGIAELFGDDVAVLRAERKSFVFRYPSASHFIDLFRSFYGPTQRVFQALDAARQAELAREIGHLLTKHNRESGNALAVPGEYFESVLEAR